MSEIRLLDEKTIDSIAAGEVVERPASAAKELVENAIDAGAGVITVEIRNGGKSLLRVTDNGSGIENEQVRRAFLRHATSKLREIEDLSRIASLGFRGEALSSICAVARVEMITRTQNEIAGTRYLIAGGEEESIEQIGAPFGTTVIMRDLFYNTPAREKFLRSAASEGSAVAAVIEQLALSHPEISFTLLAEGRQKIYTSGSGDLLECAYRLYGREITKNLLPIRAQTPVLAVEGYIGLPILSRGNRGYEFYFVNGRAVKDKIISMAIEDAFRGHLMQHRYPFTLLEISIDPAEVDVNVHPSKSEVRFSEKEKIYDALYSAVEKALFEKEEVPPVFTDSEGNEPSDKKKTDQALPPQNGTAGRLSGSGIMNEKEGPAAQNRFGKRSSAQPGGSEAGPFGMPERSGKEPFVPAERLEKELSAMPEGYAKAVIGTAEGSAKPQKEEKMPEPFEVKRHEAAAAEKTKRAEVPELVHEKQLSLFDDAKFGAKETFTIIGQVFSTFVLVEYKDSFYIIDQHAAHEKVLYEHFMKIVRERKPSTQYLMPAALVTLSAAENDLFSENLKTFTDLGFEIEPFAGREWRITGVPADLFIRDTTGFFKDLLDELMLPGKPMGNLTDIIATKACKAAVKGNTRFSTEELKSLIDDLLQLEDPYHCPHGRPVMIRMTHYEMDKRFKRTL